LSRYYVIITDSGYTWLLVGCTYSPSTSAVSPFPEFDYLKFACSPSGAFMYFSKLFSGGVPEWLIGAVSKTVELGFRLPEFESLPLRFNFQNVDLVMSPVESCGMKTANCAVLLQLMETERCPSWLKGHAWKACVRVTVPRVRISASPPFSNVEFGMRNM
jgi:hypothetical protein